MSLDILLLIFHKYKERHRDRITSEIQRNMANIHTQEEKKRDVDYVVFWQE